MMELGGFIARQDQYRREGLVDKGYIPIGVDSLFVLHIFNDGMNFYEFACEYWTTQVWGLRRTRVATGWKSKEDFDTASTSIVNYDQSILSFTLRSFKRRLRLR